MKYLKLLILSAIFFLIIFSSALIKNSEKYIETMPINTYISKAQAVFSFYPIYAYKGEYEYDKDTIYYQISQSIDEKFNDLNFYFYDYVMEDNIFDKFNAIIFIKDNPKTFKMWDIKVDENNILNIYLETYADTENMEVVNGGIILIPKEFEFADINFYTTENETTTIEKRVESTSFYSQKYYSDKKITSNLIEKYNIEKFNNIYCLRVYDFQTLINFINEFEIEIPSNELKRFEEYLKYRNLILTINDDYYFETEPKTTKDENLNIIWDKQKLKLNIKIAQKQEETLFSYIIIDPIPKFVNIENIEITNEKLEMKNYINNPIKINKEEATRNC